jgi:hypothetical protein
MVVHQFPTENLSTFIALYVATFFVSTTPSFHTVSKMFLETELEARNVTTSALTLNSLGHNRYTAVI